MHNAPPVVFPVGRFVWGHVVLFSMAMYGAVGLLMWQVQAQVSSSLWWGAWFFWCVCVVAALWWAPRQILSGGHLCWSGESWFWQASDGQQQGLEVTVCVDWDARLWLAVQRLDESGKPNDITAYVWVQERAMPSKWHGFRCAVYSRPTVDTNLARF